MTWLNEHEVAEAVERFDQPETPNLGALARTLSNLVDWTNANSDGWPYWGKPSKAAAGLQELLHHTHHTSLRYGTEPSDICSATFKQAVRPIKAFRTRQGADFTIEEPRHD